MHRSFNSIFAAAQLSSVAFAKADAATGANAETKTDGETETASNSTAVAAANGVHGKTLEIGGLKFVAKQVTRNLIKQADDVAIYVQITGAVYQGKTLKGAKLKADGTPEMEPARLAECVNLQTGSLSLIIVNAVLEGALNEQYPDNAYVGKNFAIIMRPSPEGKRYKTFELFELETSGEVAA